MSTLALKYSKKEINDAQFEKYSLKEMTNKLGNFGGDFLFVRVWPQFKLAYS